MRIVYATASASVWAAGLPVSISIGQHWPADDPVVAAYPSMFSDDPRYGLSCSVPPVMEEEATVVEQATANPGEKRDVRAPDESAEDEALRLRAHLEKLGVKADGRWSLARLREEAAKAEDSAA